MNDYELQNYQDDLDTDKSDIFMDETGDDPARELGVDADEYKEELDKIALDDVEHDHEDMRETIEDKDEADDNPASNS